MDAEERRSAERARASIVRGGWDPSAFRAALAAVSPPSRDAWFDHVLGLDAPPDDDAGLPEGCVPYLPCAVGDLLGVVEHAPVRATDVFVDVGAGVGRAAALVHLASGASTVGIEIQPHLVARAREVASRLGAPRITSIEGDAAELAAGVAGANVFFLYCPFGGARLARLLAALEPLSRRRPLTVCCVDLPLPACDWLALAVSPRAGVDVYRSRGA